MKTLETNQDTPKIGAVVLTGGENRRMNGVSKATLTWGGQTFLARIAGALGGFHELLVSVADKSSKLGGSYRTVADVYRGQGPLGGLHAALSACQSDALFAVSCDIPLLSPALADYIASFYSSAYDAVIPQTRDGGLHPLCGVYAKSVAPLLEEQLKAGDNKIRNAFARMRVKIVPMVHSIYSDEMFSNINTPAEYTALSRLVNGPPLLSVCAVKNSGKTTLLTRVLPLLREAGLNVAIIKHDAHNFEPDVPGTDSHRLRMAGAANVAVYSGNRYMLAGEWDSPDYHRLLPWFNDVDLIIMEGGKQLDLPKIEIVRAANSQAPVCDPSDLVLLVTDTNVRPEGVPVAGLEDYPAIAEAILRFARGGADALVP